MNIDRGAQYIRRADEFANTDILSGIVTVAVERIFLSSNLISNVWNGRMQLDAILAHFGYNSLYHKQTDKRRKDRITTKSIRVKGEPSRRLYLIDDLSTPVERGDEQLMSSTCWALLNDAEQTK